MYETKVEYPAVFILARAVKDERRIIAMLDNKVLTNDAEMGARLMTYRLLEEAGAIPYELTLANVDQAEAVKAERIAWLSYENGWGPNPETNEAEDAPTSPAPEAPQTEEPTQDQDTTDPAESQAVLTVRYQGMAPFPYQAFATGLLVSVEGAERMHSVAETRLELTRLGYIPDYTLWQVVHAGENTTRREVYVKANGNGHEPEETPLQTLAASEMCRAKPITEEQRARWQKDAMSFDPFNPFTGQRMTANAMFNQRRAAGGW